MAVNIVGYSKQWLIADKTKARLYSETRDVLTAKEPAQQAKIRAHSPLAKQMLYLDKTRARLHQLSRDVLTAGTPANDTKVRAHTPLAKDMLVQAITRASLYQQSKDMLTVRTTKPSEPSRLYRMYTQVLYRVLDLTLYQLQKDTLKKLDQVPTIFAKYSQNLQAVTQRSVVLPMASVISVETARQSVSMVLQKSDDMPFVWSKTRVTQGRLQVVQSLPNSVISVERVPQARNLVTSRAAMPVPLDMVSMENAGQNVLLICQSLDIPYQPTSGIYAHQQTVMAVQASSGMAMWRSPASVAQYSVRVVQKLTREPFPRSLITVGEQVSQVVQGVHMSVPLGMQETAQNASQVVQATDMPVPVGMELATQAVQLTAQQTVMPQGIGMVIAAQEVAQVLQKSDAPLPISNERVAQEVSQVLQARPLILPISQERVKVGVNLVSQRADYEVPGNMLARTRAAQARVLVLQPTEYGPVVRQSQTTLPQARLVFTLRADPSWYLSPATLYDRSRFVFAPQFVELTAQLVPGGQPWSKSCVAQYSILTATHTNEPSPSQMANSGVFAHQTIAQIGYEATYFSTDFPVSDADVYQVNQQYAMQATYPDAFLPTNYAVTFKIDKQIAFEVVYDAPESLFLPVTAAQVTEHFALASGYPDPEALHQPIQAFLVTQQLSVSATYPGKDVIQSSDRVAQLAQQTAITAKYPDKSTPQATERVMQVRNSIVTRDTSMYQLPVRPRRHRVRINVRLVY